jgi:hypothetical protein
MIKIGMKMMYFILSSFSTPTIVNILQSFLFHLQVLLYRFLLHDTA